MTSRRQFLAGLLATGLAPGATWADAGAPAYLSAAARDDGEFVLCGISVAGAIVFEIPLPARGHAAAAHPVRPEAVAFARRPGTFALVLDCATGKSVAALTASAGRHFYGHGVFSRDGAWLFTTENDFEAGEGRIGVWDASNGYVRVEEFASGGIGPHDIKRLPGSDTLVVANGGIDTHPESGRTKLNLPTMAPNLSYVANGTIVETVALAPEWHKNSIRHLAVAEDGQVAFGMQWLGDTPEPALVGMHRRGAVPQLLEAPDAALRPMQAYVGSIAFTRDDSQVVVTSPRGGIVQSYDVASGALASETALTDVSGVAPATDGVFVSTGAGKLVLLSDTAIGVMQTARMRWDNHLVSLSENDQPVN